MLGLYKLRWCDNGRVSIVQTVVHYGDSGAHPIDVIFFVCSATVRSEKRLMGYGAMQPTTRSSNKHTHIYIIYTVLCYIFHFLFFFLPCVLLCVSCSVFKIISFSFSCPCVIYIYRQQQYNMKDKRMACAYHYHRACEFGLRSFVPSAVTNNSRKALCMALLTHIF